MQIKQYTPKKEHEFRLFECDWKTHLDRNQMNQAMRHVNKIKGEFVELNVYACDAKLFYAGPEGIENWIRNNKHGEDDAWVLFMDYSTAGEKDSSVFLEVHKWYFDGKNVYVMVPTEWNDKKKKHMNKMYMEYSEWIKLIEETNKDL